MSMSPSGDKNNRERSRKLRRLTALGLTVAALFTTLVAAGWLFSDFTNLVSQVPELHEEVAALAPTGERGPEDTVVPLVSDTELLAYGMRQQHFSSGVLALLLSILLLLFAAQLTNKKPSQTKLYIVGGISLLVLVTLVGLANANILAVVVLPIIAGLFLTVELADEVFDNFGDALGGEGGASQAYDEVSEAVLHDPMLGDPLNEIADAKNGREKSAVGETKEAESDEVTTSSDEPRHESGEARKVEEGAGAGDKNDEDTNLDNIPAEEPMVASEVGDDDDVEAVEAVEPVGATVDSEAGSEVLETKEEAAHPVSPPATRLSEPYPRTDAGSQSDTTPVDKGSETTLEVDIRPHAEHKSGDAEGAMDDGVGSGDADDSNNLGDSDTESTAREAVSIQGSPAGHPSKADDDLTDGAIALEILSEQEAQISGEAPLRQADFHQTDDEAGNSIEDSADESPEGKEGREIIDATSPPVTGPDMLEGSEPTLMMKVDHDMSRLLRADQLFGQQETSSDELDAVAKAVVAELSPKGLAIDTPKEPRKESVEERLKKINERIKQRAEDEKKRHLGRTSSRTYDNGGGVEDSLEFEMPDVDDLSVTGLMERPSLFLDKSFVEGFDEDLEGGLDEDPDADRDPSSHKQTLSDEDLVPMGYRESHSLSGHDRPGTNAMETQTGGVGSPSVKGLASSKLDKDELSIVAELVSQDLEDARFDAVGTLDDLDELDKLDAVDLDIDEEVLDSAPYSPEGERSEDHRLGGGRKSDGISKSEWVDEPEHHVPVSASPITEEVSSIHDLIEDDLLSETSMFYSPVNEDVGAKVLSDDRHSQSEPSEDDPAEGGSDREK
ncbi:MAG: hypothetical protein ACWA5X_08180 [bacterium]